MTHRGIAIALTTLSLLGILLGYLILWHADWVFFCKQLLDCSDVNLTYGVVWPLYQDTYLLPPLFFVLIFVKKDIFWGWVKYIAWTAVPLIGLIIGTEAMPHSFFYLVDRSWMTEKTIQFFVLISVIFIAFKYWQLGRGKRS